MSRNNNASPDSWLDMPLAEFRDWIDANNKVNNTAKQGA